MIPGLLAEIENEYLKVFRESVRRKPEDFAARLGESECSSVYWLAELAKQGRIRILAVELVKEHEVPCSPKSFANCQRKSTCPIPEIAKAWCQSLDAMYPVPDP